MSSMPRLSIHQAMVDDFMVKAGQRVRYSPTHALSADERLLRGRLILEEALETARDLGLSLTFEAPTNVQDWLRADGQLDLEGVIDGCCDLRVVTTGTMSAIGCDCDTFQPLIDLANLAKFGPGGYRREDGKWMKPPDWKKPDIMGTLLPLM